MVGCFPTTLFGGVFHAHGAFNYVVSVLKRFFCVVFFSIGVLHQFEKPGKSPDPLKARCPDVWRNPSFLPTKKMFQKMFLALVSPTNQLELATSLRWLTAKRHICGGWIPSAPNILFSGGIWVFPKIVAPQNGWFIMENPIKNWRFGGTPIFGNTHLEI